MGKSSLAFRRQIEYLENEIIIPTHEMYTEKGEKRECYLRAKSKEN